MANVPGSRGALHSSVTVGSRLYHWLYGPLIVTKVEGAYLHTKVEEPEGIIGQMGGTASIAVPQTRRFLAAGVAAWLFAAPDDVGLTVGLATGALSAEEFATRLHRAFDVLSVIGGSRIPAGVKARITREIREARRRQIEADWVALRARASDSDAAILAWGDMIEEEKAELEALQHRLAAVDAQIDRNLTLMRALEAEQTPALLKANLSRVDGLRSDIRGLEGEREGLCRSACGAEGRLKALHSEKGACEERRSAMQAEMTALASQLALLTA